MVPPERSLLCTPRLKSRPGYELVGDEFVKYGLDDLATEAEKARALARLGRERGFIAPDVLRVDASRRAIHYQWLPGLRSVREVYLRYVQSSSKDPDALALFTRIGVTLARVHQGLSLSRTREWLCPRTFSQTMTDAFGPDAMQALEAAPRSVLHCDFGFSNVNLGERGVIVLIDPSANGFVTYSSDVVGPVYIDLANFVACLEGLVPLRYYPRIRWHRIPELRGAFIAGYESGSPQKIDRALLARASYATARCYLERRLGNRLLGGVAHRLLFNRLKGNVPK